MNPEHTSTLTVMHFFTWSSDLFSRHHSNSIRPRASSVGIVHYWFHVIAGEKAGDAVTHSLKPAIIVLLDDIDNGAFHEGQLVIFILGVVIDGHH